MNPDQQTAVEWLRWLSTQGGKGTVNNIDARALGRIAERLEQAERQIGTAQLIALEFGFKAHERGDNLQKAISDFQRLRRP